MRVDELIKKLTQFKNDFGNVDVEYNIDSSLDHETEINEVEFDADEEKIILSSF